MLQFKKVVSISSSLLEAQNTAFCGSICCQKLAEVEDGKFDTSTNLQHHMLIMRFKWVIHNAQQQHNITKSHKLTKYIKIRGQCIVLLKVLIHTRNTGHSTKQQNIPHHERHHHHLLHLFFDWLTVSLPFSLGIKKMQTTICLAAHRRGYRVTQPFHDSGWFTL